VHLDHAVDQRCDKYLERRLRAFDYFALNHAINLADVPLVQSDKNSTFIWKILVYGTNTDSGSLRNTIRCKRGSTAVLKKPSPE
jgi:hypothetical protein